MITRVGRAERKGTRFAVIGGVLLRASAFAIVGLACAYGLSWLASRSPAAATFAGVVAVSLLLRTVVGVLRAPSRLRATAAMALTLALAVGATAALAAIRPAAGATSTAAQPALSPDARDDCVGCPPGREITGLATRQATDRSEIHVGLAGQPAAGDGVWVWFGAAPVHPVLVERQDDGWRATVPEAATLQVDEIEVRTTADRLVLVVRGTSDLGPLALVSTGGDRAPDIGWAGESAGSTAPTGTEIDPDLDAAVAKVQAGFPFLDPLQRDLARTVLARQMLEGTYRYDLALADNPGLPLAVEVSVRYPHLAQHISVDLDGSPTLAQSLFVSPGDVTACTWLSDGTARCEPEAGLELPIDGLVAMVAAPSRVRVYEAPPRTVAGEPVRCLLVTASPPDGPSPGESCTLADGTLAVNDNRRTGHRLVLVERASKVDDATFDRP